MLPVWLAAFVGARPRWQILPAANRAIGIDLPMGNDPVMDGERAIANDRVVDSERSGRSVKCRV